MKRGISLLEVLFSMLLVTVGLFGAIALLPVAAHQSKRGRVADAQSVTGEMAVNEFHLREMNRTANWMHPTSDFFKARLVDSMGAPMLDPATMAPIETRFIPSVGYCIDPLMVASQGNAVTTKAGNGSSRFFPYYTLAAASNDYAARMERITLASGLGGPMSLQHAMSVFVSDDDLFLDRVNDASVPASQIYSRLASGENLRRLSSNELSWFATLAPLVQSNKSSTSPETLANNPVAPENFTLSVVVLYKRPLTTLAVETGDASIIATERLVDVAGFPGIGISGGEAVFQFRSGRGETDLDVRPGEWVMLSGSSDVSPATNYGDMPLPKPFGAANGSWKWFRVNDAANSLSVQPSKRPVFGWYRVVDADTEIVNGNQRNVTLAGGDWPIQADRTQATLVSGVVAVYERTIRLIAK